MKKIIKYIIVLTLGLMLAASCSDDYLNRGSQIKFDDSNFWTSEGNVKTFCWEFYNRFIGYSTGTDGDFYFTTFTDDQAANGMNIFATTAPSSSTYWTFAYIRKTNLLLNRVDKVPMSDDAKNHYKGIARFFRAFEYANLVKRYGDVPWIDTYLDQSQTEEIYKPRTSRDVVVDNIIADLDFAAANIRTKLVAEALSDKNTVNRNVANALIARVALYEASICKYQSNNPTRAAALFTKAKNAAQIILDQGYTLSVNYKDVYSSLDLSGNKEVLLYKNYVAAIMTHSVVGYTNSSTMISGLTKDAIDAYLCKDGLPISLSTQYQGDADVSKTLTNRDDRLLKTVDNVLCYIGTPNSKGFTSSTGYKITKFDNPAMSASEILAPGNTTDAPLFWLAETMLNYAEAAVELGTATQADLDKTVNLLRLRGGIAPLNVSNVPNDPKRDPDVSALLWEVRRERRVELIMDGFRQWDLRRWKKLTYLDPNIKPDIFKGAKIVPKPSGGPTVDANNYITPYGSKTRLVDQLVRNYLDPLPTGQLTLYQIKNIEFPQNPGW
jgi:starch-binding outer membrane protein, SusD/RagB family